MATTDISWRKMMAMRRFGSLNVLWIVAMYGVATKSTAACSCDRQSVQEAYSNAEVVFEGKVVSIDGATTCGQWPAGRVRFKVSTVWKGGVRSDFEMPAVLQCSSCLGFYSHHLKPGNELLVYASMVSWTPAREKGYFTNACARTRLLKDAKQDLAALPNMVKRAVPWHNGEVVDVVRDGKFYDYRILAGRDRYTGRSTKRFRVTPGRQVKFAIAGERIYIVDEGGTTRELQYTLQDLLPAPPPSPKQP